MTRVDASLINRQFVITKFFIFILSFFGLLFFNTHETINWWIYNLISFALHHQMKIFSFNNFELLNSLLLRDFFFIIESVHSHEAIKTHWMDVIQSEEKIWFLICVNIFLFRVESITFNHHRQKHRIKYIWGENNKKNFSGLF